MAHNEDDFDPGIDEHALDKEWLGQPRLYYKWATHKAKAAADVTAAENRIKSVRAEVFREISENPTAAGVVKATVDGIKAAIEEDPRVLRAEREYIDAKYELDMMAAAVGALDHRKRALENLVELQTAGYYAEPMAKPASREAMEEVNKRGARTAGRREGRGRGDE